MKKKRIIVVVEGGLIQEITGIPKGFEIEVRDFDTDLRDDSDPRVEEFGDEFAYVTIWD